MRSVRAGVLPKPRKTYRVRVFTFYGFSIVGGLLTALRPPGFLLKRTDCNSVFSSEGLGIMEKLIVLFRLLRF